MKFNYFLAKRFNYTTQDGKKKRLTGIAIAKFGIAVGIAVMIISIAVVVGFKKEIASRVIGFGAHIQVVSYNSTSAFEKQPITIDEKTINQIANIKHIKHIDKITTKTGIIKTDENFKGVIFKGVEQGYNINFFRKSIIEGDITDFSDKNDRNKIIISQNLANMLNIKMGDDIFAYFFEQQIRVRKFNVMGIYSTTFSDFDNMFVVCSADIIKGLNQWDTTQITSLEITVDRFDGVEKAAKSVNAIVGNRFSSDRASYKTEIINEIYPEIFNWLDMLNINTYVILFLMILVAGFSMTSGILILILEKIQVIGTLKALGMKNREIRKVFLINAMFFVTEGMVWGNIVAILLIIIQYYLHIIPLKAEYYYINYVPVDINIISFIILNIVVWIISILIMLIPSHIITKISPIKSIKFE